MKNNLEPRAKIGDVVVVFVAPGEANMECTVTRCRKSASENHYVLLHNCGRACALAGFTDKDILKNLTTNVSYE